MAYQQTLPNGTVLIEEFRILGHLGSGGFANTYLATDLTLGREVAIKEYFPSELAVRAGSERVEVKSSAHGAQFEWALGRFVREAKTLAKFRHPSVVRVFRVFNANATAYIVLEFVRGSNMEAWIKNLGRPPTQAELDELLPPLLDALEVVHGAGILHRDIKPANIYIRAADHTPVLLDFGAARYAAGDYAGTTAAIVSKGYSPHEAYATDSRLQGPWTDIYGLAATIYRALSGSAPPESTMRVLEDQCVAAVDLDLPESGDYRASFLEAIDWALEVMPKQRPQSVAEWRYRLLPNTVALPKLRDANGEPTTIQEWNPMSDRQSDATTFDPPAGSTARPRSATARPTGTARTHAGTARQSTAAAAAPAPAAAQASSRPSVGVDVRSSPSVVRPRSGGSVAASSGASGAPRSTGAGIVNRQSQPVGNRTFMIGLALFAAGGIALVGQWFVSRKPSTPVQIAAPSQQVEGRDSYIVDRNRIDREAAAEQARKDREAAAAEQARKERETAAAEQARKDREAAAAEQARKERETAAAEQARKERETAVAEQARKERETAVAEQARKERETAAAEQARKERETAAAEQARKERETAAAEKARKEREAAAAEQARKDREAAAAEQARKEREAAATAEKARKDREAAAAEQARKEREAAAAEQARKEREAAAAAEQARKEREAAAAEQARKEREAAAAEQARKEREAAAAEQVRKERELADARRKEDERRSGVELAAANIGAVEPGSVTGAPAAVEASRRIGYLKDMQTALKASKCYDGALSGDLDATRNALASFEKKYRGDVVKIDVASASSNDFERWLGWFWRQESFSCYEKPSSAPSGDAEAARRRDREAEEARQQRRREREAEEARQARREREAEEARQERRRAREEEEARQERRREREQQKPRKIEREKPAPKAPKGVYKAPVYKAPRSSGGGGGGGGGGDLLRGGR